MTVHHPCSTRSRWSSPIPPAFWSAPENRGGYKPRTDPGSGNLSCRRNRFPLSCARTPPNFDPKRRQRRRHPTWRTPRERWTAGRCSGSSKRWPRRNIGPRPIVGGNGTENPDPSGRVDKYNKRKSGKCVYLHVWKARVKKETGMRTKDGSWLRRRTQRYSLYSTPFTPGRETQLPGIGGRCAG